MSNKIYATLLLDENDHYVYDNGNLPNRTQWDKKLLSNIINKELVTNAGMELLPPSLQEKVRLTQGVPTVPITVPEIEALADILIITRVASTGQPGKKFRLDNFIPILKEQRIEVWRRK